MKKLLLIALLISSISALAQKNDKQQIDDLRANWSTYLQSKQLEKAVAQYTDDAIFLSPDGHNFHGKKDITGLYKQVMKMYNISLTFRSNGIIVSGNMAYDSGDYSETMQDNSTHKSVDIKGSFLMTLLKQGGLWKISRMMWTEGK